MTINLDALRKDLEQVEIKEIRKGRVIKKKMNIRLLSDENSMSTLQYVMPTGYPPLDFFLFGCGGLPIGKAVEIFGAEGTGKTTFIANIIYACQQQNVVPILWDTESAFALDMERIRRMGIDPDNVLLSEAETLEDGYKYARKIFEKLAGKPSLFMWDSIAATQSDIELENPDLKAAGLQRGIILSSLCRALTRLTAKSNAGVIFVNQVRSDPNQKGVMGRSSPTESSGSRAVKHFASMRITMQYIKSIQEGDQHVGREIKFRTKKNKYTHPFKEVIIPMYYDTGFDRLGSLTRYAIDNQIVKRKLGKIFGDGIDGFPAKDNALWTSLLKLCEWEDYPEEFAPLVEEKPEKKKGNKKKK